PPSPARRAPRRHPDEGSAGTSAAQRRGPTPRDHAPLRRGGAPPPPARPSVARARRPSAPRRRSRRRPARATVRPSRRPPELSRRAAVPSPARPSSTTQSSRRYAPPARRAASVFGHLGREGVDLFAGGEHADLQLVITALARLQVLERAARP